MTNSTEKPSCAACRLPKADRECGVCADAVCRQCAFFLDAQTFSFLPKIPEELSHNFYCPSCQQQHIEPAQTEYEETMARAREVYFFSEAARMRLIPLQNKGLQVVKVDACEDRDELILRLAFLAVRQGFNAIIEGHLDCEKIRNAGYQKSKWSGRGLPANVDVERLEKIDRRERGEWE